MRGRNYLRQRQFEYALAMYQEAVKLDPNFALAYAGIGKRLGRHERISRSRSRASCRTAWKRAPRPSGLRRTCRKCCPRERAYTYAQLQYDEAIQLALQAIAQQPECEGAHDVLGRAYFASGRYEDAARLAESALEVVSNDYNALIPLINSFERLGRMADAERLRRREMEVLQDQLQQFPDDVRARILLAADLAIFGDTEGRRDAG